MRILIFAVLLMSAVASPLYSQDGDSGSTGVHQPSQPAIGDFVAPIQEILHYADRTALNLF